MFAVLVNLNNHPNGMVLSCR